MNVQQDTWQNMALEPVWQSLAGHDVPWVSHARQSAFERFSARGFPSRSDEEWKYTEVSAISKRISLSPASGSPSVETANYARILNQDSAHLMVFVDGHYASGLSRINALPMGARLTSLAGQLKAGDRLPELLFDKRHEHTPFTALNNAFATDGAVLDLAPGTVLDAPVYLLFIASGEGASIYPRNIVVAGAHASATVIEHYVGMPDAHSFTNAVTQISLGDSAVLQHYKLEQEGGAAYHIGGIHTEQAAGSRFNSHSFVFGSRLTRNDITSQLNGPECACTLNGLYLLDDKQHVDHHTCIKHVSPSGTSREYYRGMLEGESHAVFNGKVIVSPYAIKTDAHQANHHLLLSRQAEVDTKPQLEIFADDVKCTHGATVGQLSDDGLFYLRSRGIDMELARSILIYGFFNDIIRRVDVPDLRTRIEHLVLDQLPQGEQIKELR